RGRRGVRGGRQLPRAAASHIRHGLRVRRHATRPEASAMPQRTHTTRALAALTALLVLLALCDPGAAHATDTIVVGLRPGTLAASALDAAGAVQVGVVPRLRVGVVRIPPPHRGPALRTLRHSRSVRYAEPLHQLHALAEFQPDP